VLLVDDFGPDRFGSAPPDCIPRPPEELIQPNDLPQDQCHDQYLREGLERALDQLGHPEWVVDRYEPLDPASGQVIPHEVEIDSTSFDYWVYTGPVTLVNLARYKMVFWNVKAEQGVQLRIMNLFGEDNFLAVFIEAGGHVWITGTGTYSRTRDTDVGLSPFGFEGDDFLFRFLKLESETEGAECRVGCFRTSGTTGALQRQHGFDAGYASKMARLEGYPDTLRVARPPYNQGTKGIPSCEGMVVPLGLDINPRLRLFGGRLDTLYFYLSNGSQQVIPPAISYMDQAACALRYSGPGQGKVMVYGFPLYFFPQDEVDGVMARSIEWFLQE
jgi:hypothetical protein